MRLLTTLTNQDEIQKFSKFLHSQGIENTVDVETGKDWGQPDYGTHAFKLWVIDEDQTELALDYLDQFMSHPNNSIYNQPPIKTTFTLPKHSEARPRKKTSTSSMITLYLIGLCAAIFAWTSYDAQSSPLIYTSKPRQILLFDFPKAYEFLNTLVTKYGTEALRAPQSLPLEGIKLVNAYKSTPYWQGFYDEALSFLTTGQMLPDAPLFEKISQGELWRLITPIFLHGDIFHLLFNMAWLYILGKQLEFRMTPLRYIVFILLAAAFTNTTQYLISGPNFLGFSGVICAMLSFIWIRQSKAPWEGYQMQKSTFNFMMIFLFGMLTIQIIAFALQAGLGYTLGTQIANGAHISGLALGWLLARAPYFTKRVS